jgi:GYF domain 2
MGNEWHYTQNGQPAPAPVPTAQLKQLAATGLLKPDDLVWQEGMINWVAASSVKGLFAPVKAQTSEMPATGRSTTRAIKADNKPAPKPEVPGEDEHVGLHPVLVLLLTVITLGIFGIVYAFRIGGAYSARLGQKTADASGRPLGMIRHPVVMLVLTGLTFGFYLPYWIVRVLEECAAYTGQRDIQPRLELSLMLVIPFYTFYLAVYRVPEMVWRVQTLAGMDERGVAMAPGVYLNPFLVLTLPILCMKLQDTLNQVWIAST